MTGFLCHGSLYNPHIAGYGRITPHTPNKQGFFHCSNKLSRYQPAWLHMLHSFPNILKPVCVCELELISKTSKCQIGNLPPRSPSIVSIYLPQIIPHFVQILRHQTSFPFPPFPFNRMSFRTSCGPGGNRVFFSAS